jgi:hypothetical protein
MRLDCGRRRLENTALKGWKVSTKKFLIMNMNVTMIRVYIRRTFQNKFLLILKQKKVILATISNEILELEKIYS